MILGQPWKWEKYCCWLCVHIYCVFHNHINSVARNACNNVFIPLHLFLTFWCRDCFIVLVSSCNVYLLYLSTLRCNYCRKIVKNNLLLTVLNILMFKVRAQDNHLLNWLWAVEPVVISRFQYVISELVGCRRRMTIAGTSKPGCKSTCHRHIIMWLETS